MYHDTPIIYVGHKSTRLIKNQIYSTITPIIDATYEFPTTTDDKLKDDIKSINSDNKELFKGFNNILDKVKTPKNRLLIGAIIINAGNMIPCSHNQRTR